MNYENDFSYQAPPEVVKQSGKLLIVSTLIILLLLLAGILIPTDYGMFLLVLSPFYLLWEIVVFFLWYLDKNSSLKKCGEEIRYTKLSRKERVFSLSDVALVSINQYGRIQLKNALGKKIFTGNVSETAGAVELLLLLQARNVPFEFNPPEMRNDFLKELEAVSNAKHI